MVFEKVKAIIAEELDVEEDLITPETELDELGADAFDIAELIRSLGEEFDIEIPEESMEGFSTVGNVVKYIKKSM